MQQLPNIAVLSYSGHKYSETFIRNQVRHLSGNVHYLYGGELPAYYGQDVPFLKTDFVSRVKHSINRWLFNKTSYQQQLYAVEKYLVNNDIEVVLANYAITAFPVMEICRRNNIPLIVHFHGWTAYRKSVLLKYQEQYSVLFKTATKIIAVSFDMKQQLQALGAPAEKICVLRCGADENLFDYTADERKSNVFFCPGRFCETKNPQLTIRAFYQALKHVPDAKLVMGGGDEGLLQTCLDLVKELGIEDKVTFKGVLSHQQVAELMQTSAALVIHSATTADGEKEGTPVTVLEAALSGLPIVATKHAGIAEVFENELSALLSDEFDVEQMAANMVRIVKEKELSPKLAGKAYDVVKANYTLQHYSKQLNELIGTVVKQSAGR